MRNLKHRLDYIREELKDYKDVDDWLKKSEWKPLKHEKRIPLSQVEKLCYDAFVIGSKGDMSFKTWWSDQKLNENMLPKQPIKKVKCLECGESVCDNLGYKIGHLYNRHNCKPSVDDYIAKNMLKKYFPSIVKESNSSKYNWMQHPDYPEPPVLNETITNPDVDPYGEENWGPTKRYKVYKTVYERSRVEYVGYVDAENEEEAINKSDYITNWEQYNNDIINEDIENITAVETDDEVIYFQNGN
jgi:hypothetical protein